MVSHAARLFTVFLSMLLISGAAHPSELCKWVDEEGTVHYAEQCPESIASTSVQIDSAAPADADDPYAATRSKMAERQPQLKISQPSPNTSQSPDFSKMSPAQLKQECERQREARLGPERRQQIKQCSDSGEMSPKDCQNFYADWGDGGFRGGHVVPRKYDNLPVCVAARADGS